IAGRDAWPGKQAERDPGPEPAEDRRAGPERDAVRAVGRGREGLAPATLRAIPAPAVRGSVDGHRGPARIAGRRVRRLDAGDLGRPEDHDLVGRRDEELDPLEGQGS